MVQGTVTRDNDLDLVSTYVNHVTIMYEFDLLDQNNVNGRTFLLNNQHIQQ